MSVITHSRVAEPASGRRKALLLLVIVLALAAAGWIAMRAMAHRAAAAAEREKAAPSGPMELAAADVATVELRALARRLPLSGTLTPRVQAMVKARVSGDVLDLAVREGETVQQGQVLARIDIRNLAAQLAAQRAAVDKARADLALAKVTRDSNAKLLEQKFISQNAFDAAQSSYDAAAASLKVAEAQARLAQVGLDDAVVRAPISGIVSQRLVQPGEKVSPDAPLLAIVDLSRLEFEAPVPASDVPGVKLGQSASFSVGGFGARRFDATVERINPATDAGTRAIKLYLSVDNRDGALMGGMFAQGELVLEQSAPAPTVPSSAVRSEAGVDYVLVIDGGRLVRRQVILGLKADDAAFVEVRDGLAVGTPLLAARIDSLHDGSAVKLAAPQSAP